MKAAWIIFGIILIIWLVMTSGDRTAKQQGHCILVTDDLDVLMEAMIRVESSGRNDAVGVADEIGCLQITSVVIHEVNNYPNNKKIYTLHDRYDRTKSMEICRLYVEKWAIRACIIYNIKAPSNQMYARIWNGGPNGWRKESTEIYWDKVLEEMGK